MRNILIIDIPDSAWNTFYYSKKWNQVLGPYLDVGKGVKLYGPDLKLTTYVRLKKEKKANKNDQSKTVIGNRKTSV